MNAPFERFILGSAIATSSMPESGWIYGYFFYHIALIMLKDRLCVLVHIEITHIV